MVTSIINLSLPEGDANRKIHIYGYQADSYSETLSSPNFESMDIAGRSSPIAYYNGGGARSVAFTMLFHRDMVSPWSAAIRTMDQPAGIEVDMGTDSEFVNTFLNDEANMSLPSNEVQNLVNKYAEQWSSAYGGSRSTIDRNGQTWKRNYGSSNSLFDKNGNLNSNGNAWWKLANSQAEANATARFHLFLNKIKALNYPVYTSAGVIPPKAYLKIGGDSNTEYLTNYNGYLFEDSSANSDDKNFEYTTFNGNNVNTKLITTTDGTKIGGIRLKGYCSANINYDGIVKYNSLISCSVDFTFTEVIDEAWSATEVINGMQRYVQWMDEAAR